jgi:glycosyltransferase involved in cell wall biosynthesis
MLASSESAARCLKLRGKTRGYGKQGMTLRRLVRRAFGMLRTLPAYSRRHISRLRMRFCNLILPLNWDHGRRVLLFTAVAFPFRIARKLILFRARPYSLWAGTPIINMATNAHAERLLGANSYSLVYHTYVLTSAFDYDLSKWVQSPRFGRYVTLVVFLWACIRCDRLHFYCDQGMLSPMGPFMFNTRELQAYRMLGIKVFFWAYGADVRTRNETLALGQPNVCDVCPDVGTACICNSAVQREKINKLLHYGETIFTMGDMKEYVPGGNKQTYYWPIDFKSANGMKYRAVYSDFDGSRPLVIAHAPNHRHYKGTDFLIQAVDRLNRGGAKVKLDLIEKTPNDFALERYRAADVIFDQCINGFHGFFALEGMALGKLVMCFIRKPEDYLIDDRNCPILNIMPDTIEQNIAALLAQPEIVCNRGRLSRQYVERHYSMESFAQRLGKAYAELGVRS